MKNVSDTFDIVMLNMSAAHEWPDFHVSQKKFFTGHIPFLPAASVYEGVVNRNFFVLQKLQHSPLVRTILAVDFVFPSFRRRLKEFLFAEIWRTTEHTIRKRPLYKVEKFHATYVYSGVSYRFVPRVMRELGFRNVLLWVYNPLGARAAFSFPHHFSVFDAVDDWRHHPAYRGGYFQNALTQQYDFIDKHFNRVFTVSESLKNIFPRNAHVQWIPNGVDMQHFTAPRSLPADLARIPKPWIGYHGVIQDRIDVDLLAFVAQQRPNWSFVFVGVVWPFEALQKLRALPNVFFLGQKHYHEIPAYVQHFDVGIIPHKRNLFTESMNPLKVYEYLVCGVPVVATPVAGMESFSYVVGMASDAKAFLRVTEAALEKRTPEDDHRLRSAVRDHTWDVRVEEMLRAVRGNIL